MEWNSPRSTYLKTETYAHKSNSIYYTCSTHCIEIIQHILGHVTTIITIMTDIVVYYSTTL